MQIRSLASVLAFVVVAMLIGWFWPVDAGETIEPPAPEGSASSMKAPGETTSELPTEAPTRVRADTATLDAALLTITGRVIDAFDQPLAGVTVDEVAGHRAIATNEDGRFEWRTEHSAATRRILLLRGHAASMLAVAIVVPPNEAVVDAGDLQLTQGGGITGLVVDGSSRPLAGATVRALPATNNPLPVEAAMALLPPATTDADGRYRLGGLAAGSWRVRAAAARSTVGTSAVLRVVDGSDTRADPLQLAEGVDLRGIVVGSGGERIGGAAIRAGKESATSGPDGGFLVEHLPAGTCSVEVHAEGWLGWQQGNVDPKQELRVVLPAGLVVSGSVCDARSGLPVEQFAVRARRIQPIRDAEQGPPRWQLEHRAELLRRSAAGTVDPAARARDEAIAEEYEARLAALRRAPPSPSRIAADLGTPEPHADGRFTVDRLDEGLYVIEVLAPAHQFACTDPFELRRDATVPDVRLALSPAFTLTGRVRDRDGLPVPSATVELVRARTGAAPVAAAASGPSRFGWVVGAPFPEGDILCAVSTDRSGDFRMPHLPDGLVQLAVRHAAFCSASSQRFTVGDDAVEVVMQRRPSLGGRVQGVPAERLGDVYVTVLGGAGNLRSTAVGADGCYRFEALEPGEYVVRTTLGELERKHADLVHSLFTARSEAPPRDVVLAPGEVRNFDVTLQLPPLGTVQGTVQLNGVPAGGCRIQLAVADAARPLAAVADARGSFVLRDVPAGEAELRVLVRSAGSQELYRERIRVDAGSTTPVDLVLVAGTLLGRVVARDGTPDVQLNGDLLLLPGCTEVPADLANYRRDHRVHQVSVRSALFQCDAVTPGRTLVIARLRNREPDTMVVDVTAGAVVSAEIPAGRLRQ